MREVKIFLSYCWNDSGEADKIYNYFKRSYQIELHRDKIDIRNWNSIKEYMHSINDMDYIILLISDSYLKSTNCMYEVLEVIRDINYRDKIFPAVIYSEIYNPITRAKYVKYWQDEFRNLEDILKEINVQNLGELNKDLKKRQDIASNIADFLDIISDMNNPIFKDVCIEIEKKLEEKKLIEFKLNKNYLLTLNGCVNVKIVIVAVGGAGINIINKLIDENVRGIEYVGIDTDIMSLQSCRASKCLHIPLKNAKELDMGMKLKISEMAAEENRKKIMEILKGVDLLFVICGMGGSTGTGIAPVIAKLSKEMGILTIGIVTKPFYYEGHEYTENSIAGINKMTDSSDSLIVISNDIFYEFINMYFMTPSMFMLTDNIFLRIIKAMVTIISMPAVIPIEFEDVCNFMKDKGIVHFGIGKGKGGNKALDAVKMAVEIPFLEMTISEATYALVYVYGDVTLVDATDAASYVQRQVGDELYIMFGAMYDDTEIDSCIVIVIATGMKE